MRTQPGRTTMGRTHARINYSHISTTGRKADFACPKWSNASGAIRFGILLAVERDVEIFRSLFAFGDFHN